MSAGKPLTKARVQALTEQILSIGERAKKWRDRERDVCFPALYGGTQGLLEELVRELAGAEASAKVRAAFNEADRIARGEISA